jgi:acetylornithine deacetylase/succinyl-diaminopimelate desuccinylase-like protein
MTLLRKSHLQIATLLFFPLTLCLVSPAQQTAKSKEQAARVKQYVDTHQQPLVQEFLTLVAIPDLHTDLPNIRRNAEQLRAMLDKRHMNPEVWETPSAPVVYGERIVPGATRTILFYIHFDGQPIDPKAWKQPDPFIPVLRDGSLDDNARTITDTSTITTFPDSWRIYARAAGDDKGPIEAFCGAIEALDALKITPTSSIKVILHGEEEGGGASLDYVVKKYPEKLHSDVLVVLDGPQYPSGQPTIYYGDRGGASVDVTVYTAKNSMHSGNYGNWLPDANVRLAQLISSMVDPTGKVVIKDFYSDVPPFSPEVQKMFSSVPDRNAEMMKEYGVGSLDGAAHSLQEGLNLPTFSVHIMQGGEAGAVIPAKATAQIAMRLVPENSPKVMVERVIAHIKSQGYFVVDKDPDVATLAAHPRIAKVTSRSMAGLSNAWRTDPNNPQAKFIGDGMASAWGESSIVHIRTLGGGVPANAFIDAYHVPTVGVSLANFDDNQHSDNENLRLGNLWDGIVTLSAIMTH